MMAALETRSQGDSPMSASVASFRLIDDGQEVSIAADVRQGRVLIAPDALKKGLGRELKPEGLCKDEICVPVRDREALVPDAQTAGVDLAAFAAALGRPLAVEPDASVAAIGVAPDERASQLATLEAPDFELPDLSGQTHRLSDHRGKKVLLVAYASW